MCVLGFALKSLRHTGQEEVEHALSPPFRGLRIALQPYEVSVASMFLAFIAAQTCTSLTQVLFGGEPAALLYRTLEHEYSVELSLAVVEICLSGLVLSLILTETLAYSVFTVLQATAEWTQQAVETTASPRIELTRVSFMSLLVSAGLITWLFVLPQLTYHRISNLPLWILRFLFRAPGYYELLLSAYWVVLIVAAVTFGYYAAVQYRWPRTCNRKIFHALVVALFTPAMSSSGALLVAPSSDMSGKEGTLEGSLQYRLLSFLVLGLGVALGVFILSEYVRLRFSSSAERRSRVDRREASSRRAGDCGDNCVVGRVTSAVTAYMQLFLSTEESAGEVKNGTSAGALEVNADTRPKVEISHISLLLGCAGPVWVYAAVRAQLLQQSCNAQHALQAADETSVHEASAARASSELGRALLLSLLPYIGILTLGVGDAAAAVVGKLYGRLRWSWVLSAVGVRGQENNRRTIEGSLACFVTMSAASGWILHSQFASLTALGSMAELDEHSRRDVFYSVLCAVQLSLLVVTLTEAFTAANDNIVLPMLLSLLVLLASHILFSGCS
jgi:hypothetical protein